MIDPFLIRLLIAVLAYYLFNIVVDKFVEKPKAKEIFGAILLIACVLFVLSGAFLPKLV